MTLSFSKKFELVIQKWLPMVRLHTINSEVRGHHIYKDMWMPTIGKVLVCRREAGNIYDLHAVAILRGNYMVRKPCITYNINTQQCIC